MLLYSRFLEAFPRSKQYFFKSLYQFLARYEYADWMFMNYGYEPPYAHVPLSLFPEDEPDRYCVQLYDRVTAGVDMAGRAILEVGCGRGGGLSYLHRYRGPRSSRGVDVSDLAVALCRKRHVRCGEDLWFRVGDALSLVNGDAEFDVVVNVESSHCYPSRAKFFQEAYRVLKPGGTFCYADLHEAHVDESIERALVAAGFQVSQREDLTPGVLRALALDDDRKRKLILYRAPWFLRRAVGCFAGLVGSRPQRSFAVGARQYTRWQLSKA